MTQTYYTKDIDGEYSVAQPQPTLREMEPEDTDDTMSVAERAVRIVLAKAKGVCLSKVHAIDHAGNSYLREASATQCANAIGALNIQPLIDQVHGILSLPTQPEPHPDDIAVDRFAAAMKAKMARSRDCGRYGWDDPAVCSAEDLRLFLVNHIAKGDPVDVGNFAMMLFNRHETTAQPHPEPPADVTLDAERLDFVTEGAWHVQWEKKRGEPHLSLLTVGDDGMALVYSDADARRIVACVNALAGVSTEHLEQYGLPDFAQKISDLAQQRDKLMAALEGLTDDICSLIDESSGVANLHLNGDIAFWSELEAGGQFERLTHLPDALRIIAEVKGQP